MLLVLGCAAIAAGSGVQWRVGRVRVEGLPKGIRSERIFQAGDTVDEAQLERVRSEIEQMLADEGFLRAAVVLDTASDSSGLAVRYQAEPGSRVRVAGWRISGDDSLAGTALVRLLPGRGTVFSKRNLDWACGVLLTAFEQNGFPLAEAGPAGVQDSAGWVIPELSVRAGPLVVVGFLDFAGAKNLPENLLVRLARFSPGRTYAPALVGFWRRNLDQSRVVRVTGFEIEQAGGYGVRFAVSPARANRAFGAVGYSTGDRAFTGTVELAMGNILNTGRRLEASWRGFPGRSSWHLAYTEPWVFVPWLSLVGSAGHEVFDTTGSRTSLSAEADVSTETGLVIDLATGFDQVAAIDTTQTSQTVWAGTGIGIDTREPGLNPGSGVLFAFRTTAGNRTASGRGSFVGRFEGDAGLAGPDVGPFVLSDYGHYRLVYSGAVLSELEWYRLGGARTLRGYLEEQFSGTQLGWWNCELHWQMAANAVGYPFLDVGAYEAISGWILRAGYGFGLRAATGAGTLEVDYGIGYKDSPTRGKVHLGFQAEF